jgi:hypothetical protein
MVTQQEVRRAIMWADRWARAGYHELNWKGKTYGLVSDPGTPICIKYKPRVAWYQAPQSQDGAFLFGPGYAVRSDFEECKPLGLTWFETAVITNKSETVTNGLYQLDLEWEIGGYVLPGVWCHLGMLKATYQTDPNNTKRMLLSVTVEEWTGDYAELYISSERQTYNGETDIRKFIGKTITKATPEFGYFPRSVHWLSETWQYADYCWYMQPALRPLAQKMYALLDDFGFTKVRYFPMGGYQPELPENAPWDPNIEIHAYHQCDVWKDLPREPGFMPYHSKMCLCRCYMTKRWKPPVWTFLDNELISLSGWATMLAIFNMSKYNDPKLKVKLPRPPLCYASGICYINGVPYICIEPNPCGDPGVDVYNSAEDYLLNGFTNMCNETAPPIIDVARSYLEGKVECIYAGYVGLMLTAFAMLGYGYNYPEAKTIADGLADMFVKMQWGYPFNPGQEMVGYTDRWGAVYRPDYTGTFPKLGKFINGVYTFALDSCPISRNWAYEWAEHLGWIMPGDVNIAPGSWEDHTFAYVMPLRIYDAYKWRIGA